MVLDRREVGLCMVLGVGGSVSGIVCWDGRGLHVVNAGALRCMIDRYLIHGRSTCLSDQHRNVSDSWIKRPHD